MDSSLCMGAGVILPLGVQFFLFFFVFQSGALFLAICYILEEKPVLC